jgi:hypothetical protein
MATQIDRTEIARAQAKVIAYLNCNKPDEARRWAARLVILLDCVEILRTDAVLTAAENGR